MWLFNLLNEVTEQTLQKILKTAVQEGYLTSSVGANGLLHSQGFLEFKPKVELFFLGRVGPKVTSIQLVVAHV